MFYGTNRFTSTSSEDLILCDDYFLSVITISVKGYKKCCGKLYQLTTAFI